jgi:hypothetical protein
MPPHDEGRCDRLRPAGGGPEEIDDRDLFLHRLAQPAVIRRVRVGAHECVFDNIIARVDLPVSILLIVIPDAPALPGEHGSDGQQVETICRGLKMPRCGLMRGMRSPWNSNPAARSPESRTPPLMVASRFT